MIPEYGLGPRMRHGTALGRRNFLRLASMTAGFALVPEIADRTGAVAYGEPSGQSGISKILRGNEFPIGFWWPPPPAETTPARYRQIADAGFTFFEGGNGIVGGTGNPATEEANRRALDLCAANGLQIFVEDVRLINWCGSGWPSPASCPSPADVVVKTVLSEYANHPAFAGMFIWDEPETGYFSSLAAVVRELRTDLPGTPAFINLKPSWVPPTYLEASSYEDYLQRFVHEVSPSMISFDHYPLVSADATGPVAGGITPEYFHNWAMVRSASLAGGIPSWVIIQAIGGDFRPGSYDYRIPTEAELLWQVNVSLAYGAKAIQYFTYWNPAYPPFDPHTSLIGSDGQPTQLYYATQRINNSYLNPIGKVLLPLVSESVTHSVQPQTPRGVEIFSGDNWIATVTGGPIILSRFRDPNSVANERYVLAVNQVGDAPANVRLTCHPQIDAIFRLDTGTRRFVPVPQERSLGAFHIETRLAPGDARLYLLRSNQGRQ